MQIKEGLIIAPNYIKKEIIEGDINDSKDEGEEKIND